jgi:hypothetical protein
VEAGLLGLIEPASDARTPISRDAGTARSQALPPLRAIRGDFAEIEAALLGGASEPIFAPKISGEHEVAEGAVVKPLAGLDPSERYMIAGALPDRTGAEEETRSRRTLYIMAAIVVVGLGGIAAKFQSGFSGGPQHSEMNAAALPETPQALAATARSRLPDDAFSNSNEPKPAVAEDARQMQSVVDAAPSMATATAPPVPANQGAAAPAPADTSEVAVPIHAALEPPQLPSEAKPLAAALIEPPAALPPIAGSAPTIPDARAKPAASVKSAAAAPATPRPAPIAKTAAAKPAHPAVTPKQAAANGVKTHEQAATVKPKAVAHSSAAHSAQTAEAPPEQTAPVAVQAANPAVTGVSSIMQMAVNSVNNAVKMLDWRRHDGGANP